MSYVTVMCGGHHLSQQTFFLIFSINISGELEHPAVFVFIECQSHVE